jgi:hypothetical protein
VFNSKLNRLKDRGNIGASFCRLEAPSAQIPKIVVFPVFYRTLDRVFACVAGLLFGMQWLSAKGFSAPSSQYCQSSAQYLTVVSSKSFGVRISPFAFCTSSLGGFWVRLSRT